MLTIHPESRDPAASMNATLDRLAGRMGAALLPKGTLRAIVARAAAKGDAEAKALLEGGTLNALPIE